MGEPTHRRKPRLPPNAPPRSPFSGVYRPEDDFPETGPDHAALKLIRQGAPGAPQPIGTCTVARVTSTNLVTGKVEVFARATKCLKESARYTGRDAIILAERAAARMDGHQCSNKRA